MALMVRLAVSKPKISHFSVFRIFKLVSIPPPSSNRGIFHIADLSVSVVFRLSPEANFPLDGGPIAISALASTLGFRNPMLPISVQGWWAFRRKGDKEALEMPSACQCLGCGRCRP